jgi:rhodanese-related sulfurtransferase
LFGGPCHDRIPARLFSRLRRREPAWIEPGDLKRLLDAGDAPLVLDVRGRDELAGPLGHIPGAANLPLPELSARFAELTADSRPVVLVCLTDKRSARAASELVASGRRHVSVLRGGTERWRREGFGEQS